MNNWYDEIAHFYNLDLFGLIGDARKLAFEQIQSVVQQTVDFQRILRSVRNGFAR